MSLKEHSRDLSQLFDTIITNPRIDVCTEELKGASILDANILRLLKRNGQMTIKALGQSLELPPSTLGSALKRLEKNHLIERSINQQDLRSYLISLSEHGNAVISSMYQEQEKLITNLLSVLTEAEQKQLLALLKKCLGPVLELSPLNSR